MQSLNEPDHSQLVRLLQELPAWTWAPNTLWFPQFQVQQRLCQLLALSPRGGVQDRRGPMNLEDTDMEYQDTQVVGSKTYLIHQTPPCSRNLHLHHWKCRLLGQPSVTITLIGNSTMEPAYFQHVLLAQLISKTARIASQLPWAALNSLTHFRGENIKNQKSLTTDQ